MTCDRCGEDRPIPINPLTGEPIRSVCFTGPEHRVQWPWALLCTPCWWALAMDARKARDSEASLA
jgi:hypothetical protein